MNTFSVPADRTDELPACSIVAAPLCDTSSPVLLPDVGAVPHDRIARYLRDLDAADAIGGCFFDAIGQAQAKRGEDRP